jgi:prevent-host-death family protein
VLEAKTRLSELLTQVQQGQEFTITRHGVAVTRLMPMAAASTHAARSLKAAVDAAFAALDTLRQGVTSDVPLKDALASGRG